MARGVGADAARAWPWGLIVLGEAFANADPSARDGVEGHQLGPTFILAKAARRRRGRREVRRPLVKASAPVMLRGLAPDLCLQLSAEGAGEVAGVVRGLGQDSLTSATWREPDHGQGKLPPVWEQRANNGAERAKGMTPVARGVNLRVHFCKS